MTTLILKRTVVEENKFKTINQWMPTGQGTELPEILQGIYFMDGNVLPDDCVTLSADWNATTLTLQLPVFGPRQWTFHPSLAGRGLLMLVKLSKFVYEIQFKDETLRQAVVIPSIRGFRIPRWLLEFTMTQTEESIKGEVWDRRNTIFFRLIPVGGYTLRKIVTGKGRKTPAFAKMLSQVTETCIVVVNSSS